MHIALVNRAYFLPFFFFFFFLLLLEAPPAVGVVSLGFSDMSYLSLDAWDIFSEPL